MPLGSPQPSEVEGSNMFYSYAMEMKLMDGRYTWIMSISRPVATNIVLYGTIFTY